MTSFNDAWQAALAAEQQAVFGYSLLGPRLGTADQATARSSLAAHEALRDVVDAAMTAAGLVPGEPAADYPSLYPVSSASAARALAVRLEEDCAAAWRFAFRLATVTTRRREAQTALTGSAVRATQWRRIAGVTPATTAFPGI
ncbi:DUF4439 domain-containing protein [Jatrophihabitans sp.]|uniref:DUF4439 domain-containing protein n=1 Tax=Jatrophihabitans sp. TaxID=1932789 RepID=UPI0030C7614D|nr:hypothetical protein [Jatrophihabitans sp.]